MIQLYDTKDRALKSFVPCTPTKVSMYVCGPTVYNFIHIGNARTFISFDVIRRYLMWSGFEVTFVQNITDVDDKIIAKAQEQQRDAGELAAEYTQAFIDDMHAVGVLDPTIRPKATENIEAMIDLIAQLIAQGHAYEAQGDVYFSVRSYAGYGELSGRDIDEMESGHRTLRAGGTGVEERKRDLLDFALWKAAKPGEPAWASPWGQGRPGWHVECSVMSKLYLGLPFDIHGGGLDLVFPHHENERAQSEAACGCTFAHYWMHGGMLQVNAEKMSKSLGNFQLLRDVLKTTRPEVVRFLMLQTHYRSALEFSAQRLSEAAVALGRIENALGIMSWQLDQATGEISQLDAAVLAAATQSARKSFREAMDSDFNTCRALGVIFDFLTEINTMLAGICLASTDILIVRDARNVVIELLEVLGIVLTGTSATSCDAYPKELLPLAAKLTSYTGNDTACAMDALIALRTQARAHKDWACADRVRDGLKEVGFVIDDTPQGPRVTSCE